MVDEKSVVEEAAAQPPTEQIQSPETQEASQPKEGSKEYNFARLRETNEQLKRENQELHSNLRRIQDTVAPKPQEAPDELAGLARDDIPTIDQVDKLAERKARKIVEEALKKQEQENLLPKAKMGHTDFDEVITDENLKEFGQTNPVLAAALLKADNPWEATYEAIKMSPAYQNRKDKKQMKKDAEKIDHNVSKPVSSNAVGKAGALSNAAAYGEMSRDELYKEMTQAARRA